MNEIRHTKFGMGASVLRTEDDAFVTGSGCYTDDIQPQGVLHGYVLRAPMAHARFEISDVSDAKQISGVHAVYTHVDVAHLNAISCITPLKQSDGSGIPTRDIPILCKDTVRHLGDAIAFVVADSVAIAKDAAELIMVDYEMLPAVTGTMEALQAGSHKVYEDSDSNQAFVMKQGDAQKTASAFADAEHVSEITVINNRLVCNYMETRACLATYDAGKQRYELTVGSQGVFGMRRAMAAVFETEPEQIRVKTPDVGGGFGTKVFPYREYPLCMFAAEKLGKPVKWTCERTEHFISDAHGRDNVTTARMAMDADGKFLGMEVDLVAAMGAYLHTFGPLIPFLGISMTSGVYDIPAVDINVRGSYTNTVPTDAYRGAGRPEAAYLIERLVDKCAMDTGLDPAEIRRRNFITPEQMPYTTQTGRMYDTGEFEAHMDECMQKADWSAFASRLEESKSKGRLRGIGMATYIEACAFAGSEPAFVELKTDGNIELRIGTQSNGQGHKTAYAQLAADKLGIDYQAIDVRQGDTDELQNGGGTGGSRSIPLGGVSVTYASEALAEKIRQIASRELEAAAGDIVLEEGQAKVIGTDRTVSFANLAAAANSADELKADGEFVQNEATYPNGTHICEVEIDRDTGVIEIVGYTVVDDFGATVNPMLLEGQVHGGIVQSIGQCINENVVYDDQGQLLTASFMDYSMPRADNLPGFDFSTRNVPSTTNAMGIKGAGEAGTIGATPAVMNAIVNALYNAHGITHIDMPVTPASLWDTLKNA